MATSGLRMSDDQSILRDSEIALSGILFRSRASSMRLTQLLDWVESYPSSTDFTTLRLKLNELSNKVGEARRIVQEPLSWIVGDNTEYHLEEYNQKLNDICTCLDEIENILDG